MTKVKCLKDAAFEYELNGTNFFPIGSSREKVCPILRFDFSGNQTIKCVPEAQLHVVASSRSSIQEQNQILVEHYKNGTVRCKKGC